MQFTGLIFYTRNIYTELYKNRLSNIRSKMCNNNTDVNILVSVRMFTSRPHASVALTVALAAAQVFVLHRKETCRDII